jgi:hypothetical protein
MKKLLLLLFLLPLFAGACNNPGDSLKQGKKSKNIYPLDDPRNPDCPCHDLQRKADEEYRRLQAKENKSEEDPKTTSETKKQRKGIHLFHARGHNKNTTVKRHFLHRKKIKKLLDDCPDF